MQLHLSRVHKLGTSHERMGILFKYANLRINRRKYETEIEVRKGQVRLQSLDLLQPMLLPLSVIFEMLFFARVCLCLSIC